MTNALLILVVILIIAAVLVGIWFFMRKNKKTPIVSQFALNYSNVGAPMASKFGNTAVKPEIDPRFTLFFYNNKTWATTGDSLELSRTSDDVVIEQKTLYLDSVTGNGDWSLLENLLHQIKIDGYLNSEYTLTLKRNGQNIMSNRLDSSILFFEWFLNDFRKNYIPSPNLDIVFVLGDFVFVADAKTKYLEYLFYCINDQAKLFILHEISPNINVPDTMTFDQIRSRFSNKFIGITNAEFEEITSFEPQPPPPPISPIVVDTSALYEAIYVGIPIANDPNVLNLNSSNLQNGDSVQISKNGIVYWTINNVNLTNPSNQELSNDRKYLISGIYTLISKNNLKGENFSIDVVRNGTKISSTLIPEKVTGIKMFNDPRLPISSLSQASVISDVAKITPRPQTGGDNHPTEYMWCVDPVAKTFTDGLYFTGTVLEMRTFFQQKYGQTVNTVVQVSNYYDPTPFLIVSE